VLATPWVGARSVTHESPEAGPLPAPPTAWTGRPVGTRFPTGAPDRKLLLFLALAVLALVLGFHAASTLRWAGDDIFITLRYVANFVEGKGLVYNPGERVEGYSHFLWLMILALSQRLRFDPLETSLNLGLLSYLGILGLLALISYRIAPRRATIILPFSSLALAVHYEAAVWATGGLETSFFALLLVLGFVIYFFIRLRRSWKLSITGWILALAVLTRPDAVLFAALASLFLLGRAILLGLTPRAAAKEACLFGLPIALLLGPYLAWKVSYYGDIVPNTYYAKSAGSSYYSQGFFYLWTYFRCYVTSWLFLLAVPACLRLLAPAKRADQGTRPARVLSAFERDHHGAMVFALVAVLAYLVFFVARVGGDFMYGRFLIPALPFIYLLIEWGALRLYRGRLQVAPFGFLLIIALIFTVERGNRDRYLLKRQGGDFTVREHRGILDERWYYTHGILISEQQQMGEALAPYFAGLDATVLSRGQACLSYYARFKTCIENNGLTDAHIAHQPLARRGRVGHEKNASYDYLIERGVDFVFRRRLYRDKRYRVAFFTPPGGHLDRAEILTYHPRILSELKRRLGRNFYYMPFEAVLDDYILHELPRRPIEALREDYQEFREYYFLHNHDPERERPFLVRLSGAGLDAGRQTGAHSS